MIYDNNWIVKKIKYLLHSAGNTGGSGLTLESYQNTAMSAPVMAYVFRDVDDNIFRVYEPKRNNDVSRSQVAYVDSIDLFPFDNVDCYENKVDDVTLINIASDIKIRYCNLKKIIINGNNHAGLRLYSHTHIEGTEFEMALPNGANIYITGTNVFIHSNYFYGNQTFIDSAGDNCEVGWVTALNDQQGIYFHNVQSSYCGNGLMWEDLTMIHFYDNGSYFSDFHLGGATNIHVPPDSSYGFIIGDFCEFGSPTHRYTQANYLKLGSLSSLIPTTNKTDVLYNVDIGQNVILSTTGDRIDYTVKNLDGTAYKLGVTDGLVTATVV